MSLDKFMENVLNMKFGPLEVIKKTERKDNNGIAVSTVLTSDEEGYETALLDANGTWPVERYKTKELAIKGHNKWVKWSKTGNGKSIIKLGWSDMPEINETIILKAGKQKIIK